MIHTGVDIVKVDRIMSLLKNPRSVEKTFTDSELKNPDPAHLAGIFALKEAFYKATQIKSKNWNEIIVKHHKTGKPYLVYDKSALSFKIRSIDCSISHDGEYAIAMVILEE